MVLLSMILWFLLGLLCLLLILLFIPVYYEVQGIWQDKIDGFVKVALGPIGVKGVKKSGQGDFYRLQFLGIILFEKKVEDKPKEEKPKEKKKSQKQKKGDPKAFLDRDFLRRALQVIRELWLHCRPRIFELEGILGFEDPYYTGLFAAAQATLVPRLNITLDFSGENRDLRIQIAGEIIPVKLLIVALRFLLSKEARFVLRRWKNSKKSRAGCNPGLKTSV